jgi:hypothetical protein
VHVGQVHLAAPQAPLLGSAGNREMKQIKKLLARKHM